MKTQVVSLLAALIVPLLVPQADPCAMAAEPAPFTPSVVATGRVFAQYSLDLTDGKKLANGFELTRIYLGAKAKITPTLGATIMLDGNRYGTFSFTPTEYSLDSNGDLVSQPGAPIVYDGGSNRLNVFVKFAYAQADLLPGMTLHAGLIPTPWIGWEESLWRNRYILQTYPDLWKVFTAADFGVGLSGNLLKGGLDYNVQVVNGESFKKTEAGGYKAVQGRLTVAPLVGSSTLKGLRLTGFGAFQPDEPEGTSSRLTLMGHVGFDHSRVGVAVGYAAVTAGEVNSGGPYAWGVVHVLPQLHVLARFDRYDPSATSDTDGQNLLLAGLGYDWVKGVSTSLDFQMKSYDDTTKVSEPLVGVHSVFEF